MCRPLGETRRSEQFRYKCVMVGCTVRRPRNGRRRSAIHAVHLCPGALGTQGDNGAGGNGGGLDLTPGGRATIEDTTISGNSATTQGTDVFGSFSV